MLGLIVQKIAGSPLATYLLAGALVLVTTKAGFMYKENGNLKEARDDLKIEKNNLELANQALLIEMKLLAESYEEEERRRKLANEAADKLREENDRLLGVNNDLTTKINEYDKTPVANDCRMDAQWVSIHNAATGTRSVPVELSRLLPEGVHTSGTDASAGASRDPVTASKAEALQVVKSNYLKYQKLSDRYTTLLELCVKQSDFNFGE